MGKRVVIIMIVMLVGLGLAACSDNQPPAPTSAPPVRSPVSNLLPTLAVTATLGPPATPTVQAVLLPTATPPPEFSPTPPRFPTAAVRSPQSIPDVGPSLTLFRTTKASFQTAYARAAAQMSAVSPVARLVLAQSTLFSPDRTIWTFFFTTAGGSNPRSWSVTYDSAGSKDKKEAVTVLDRATVLLPDDVGQLPISKILDSDEISTRLARTGLPPELPLDTVYLQIVTSTKQGRVPAYIFVNGTLGKQIIVNALTGQVLQNDFI